LTWLRSHDGVLAPPVAVLAQGVFEVVGVLAGDDRVLRVTDAVAVHPVASLTDLRLLRTGGGIAARPDVRTRSEHEDQTDSDQRSLHRPPSWPGRTLSAK
jgi:hypothetical protein